MLCLERIRSKDKDQADSVLSRGQVAVMAESSSEGEVGTMVCCSPGNM